MTHSINQHHNPYNNNDIEPKRAAILAALYDTNSVENIKPYLYEGSTVLEFSPRLGSLAKQLLPIIGTTGSYTGIEPNSKHALAAQNNLKDYSNAKIVHKPVIEAIDELPKNHFDVIYFRWFLWIIPEADRTELLKKCFALLKPKGILLTEEADMTAIKTEPALDCIEQYKQNTALRCKKGNHPLTLGLEMANLLESSNPNCTISKPNHFQPSTNDSQHKLLPFYGACSTEQALLEAGLSKASYDNMLEQLKTIANDNTVTLFTTKNIFTAATKEG